MIDDTLPPLRTPAAAARPERPAIIRAWRAPASPAEARGIAVRRAGFLPGMAGVAGFMRPRTGGNDGFTKLLLHCDGANGSTSFPDASASAHTVTANGNAQVSTAQSKFGASAAFDASNNTYLLLPASSDWNFGSADLTIDFWVRKTANRPNGTYTRLVQFANGDVVQPISIADNGVNGNLMLAMSSNGTSWDIALAENLASLSLSTWYHIALVRSGSNVTLYVNGTSVHAFASSASLYFNSSATPVIGGQAGTNRNLNGNMDEIRISKGIARWTSNFTPPSGPYS